MSRPPKSIRLPDGLYDRVEAIAKAQGISVSAAMRIAIMRGVTAIEHEAAPAEAPRRRMLSKGVF